MPERSVRPAAWIFAAFSVIVVAFQLALVAGAPWGELTMGGAVRGTLPGSMRGTALVSALLVGGMAGIVLARAGVALPRWRRASRWLIWLVVAYMLIGVVLNAITPSARERMLWLPVVTVLAICAIIVARGPAETR